MESPLFCRMLNQTLNYLDHFARFTQKENVEAVERLLSAHKDLAKFERAQLGTSPPRLRREKRGRKIYDGMANDCCLYKGHFAAKTPTRPRH